MLTFICDPCKTGADLKEVNLLPGETMYQRKTHWHNKCKGATHCDCQHRVSKS